MRKARDAPLTPRAYRVHQPIPRKHHSPALLRIAGVMQARAEQAERERNAWQQRHDAQAAELAELRAELTALRSEYAATVVERDEDLAAAQRQLEEITRERDELERQLTESQSGQEDFRREAARAQAEAEKMKQKSTEHAQLTKENGELRTKLLQTERAHKKVSEVAESQRRTIRYEQQRWTELEKQLDVALKAPTSPSQNPQSSSFVGDAWAAHQRAEQLAIVNQQLRQHRDAVAHERERISNRILRLMSPGQYLDHATSAGYDQTRDPLIQQKCHELRVLDHYSRWQKKYMKRVTARKLKEQRTLDEQAIEAALSDRWKLITKPLVSLGSEPKWITVGFILDDRSEAFLQKQSEERCKKMSLRMNW